MSVGPRPQAGRSPSWHRSIGVVIVFVLASSAAWGANITITCPDSINAALAGLDKAERNDVTITGDCVEEVVVEGFQELYLYGTAVIHRPVSTEWPRGVCARRQGLEERPRQRVELRGFQT